jgi:alanyl-tRNA synthetase
MQSDELRERYLSFFESKGCVRRPSDVLVPRWDPSVLFTPAGMNQFKDHFLGRCKLEFTRATTCQKCLRTGDIDNVGRTAYHHTFFEMLGNFSFGDYFKREAILWAWEFLTSKKWLALDPARLSATVYLDDDEAHGIWQDEVGLPAERIGRLGEDENFWPASAPSQGPDGVCGPCSEIYYKTPYGNVEIWNLVFTQFNRVGDPPDNLRPLKSKNIDTGMGLERTAAVLQNVETNFHIDILRPLVEAAGDLCGVKYDPKSDAGRRLRRIADHVRACTFAIHENVYPDANKQGYVVRKLLRRAALDGHQMGVREPFLHKLVATVAGLMKNPYPELGETAERVAQGIKNEETSFFETIDRGLSRAERLLKDLATGKKKTVPGRQVFDLKQTYGFPPELTEALALDRGLAIDWDGYRAADEEHGEKSGGSKVELFKQGPLDQLKKLMHGTEFLGYQADEVQGAVVVAIVEDDQTCYEFHDVDRADPVVVVLDKTPFYGEMGGQVGDTGELVAEGFRFEVVDTQVEDGFTLHLGHLRQGKIAYKDEVTARVDAARRQAIRRAHSATHVLHYALRKFLGQQTQQKGSKVEPDLLRFDFNHDGPLTTDEIRQVETEANARVVEGKPVSWTNMPKEDAQKTGAIMLFGEKYPDVVRVVSVGDFSKELCGGTHLANTGQIGLVRITSEENIAKGIRRLTALTGPAALECVQRNEAALSRAAVALRIRPEELPERVEAMAKEIKQLRKQLASGPKAGGVSVEQLIAGAVDVGGTRVVVAEVPEAGPNDLRQLIDQLRRKSAPVAVMLGCKQPEDRVLLIAGASRDVVQRGFDSVQWVRTAAELVGGGGGGRPDMAQAGGKDPEKLSDALEAARAKIGELLSG